MVGPRAKRKTVRYAVEEKGHCERAACKALGLNRSSYCYQPQLNMEQRTFSMGLPSIFGVYCRRW